jgi:hypothetical protein
MIAIVEFMAVAYFAFRLEMANSCETRGSPPQPRRGGCAIKKKREATLARADLVVLVNIR